MLASLWLTLSTRGLSMSGRWVLVALRLAAVLVLLLGWLRPGIVSKVERESPGAIAVLLDRSESMTLPSGESDRNRWQVQQEIWTTIESSTGLKLGDTKLIPFFYDSKLMLVTDDLPKLTKSFAAVPGGRSTDLGNALSEIGRLQLDPPLRGVIVVGDGVQTQVPPKVDATVAARQMAQLDQPIMWVGIGPKPDKSQARDIAIEGLPEHFSAFVKKELAVSMVVAITGMQNVPINVSLKLSANGQQPKIVASRQIRATSNKEQLPIQFQVVLGEEGEYLLEAEAVAMDIKEPITNNNMATSFVTVREGGVKILYLYGQPSPEQLFLKRSLGESLDFETSFQWFEERSRRNWPVDLTRTVDLDEYDAIIIGDLDVSALDANTQRRLKARVRQGAGILFLGGYHSFDAGGYGLSELAEVFPIELGRIRQQFDAPINGSFQIEQDVRVAPGRPHPITTFAAEPENTGLWRALPPLKGMNRFGVLKNNPGVSVLLESERGDPALVAAQFGQGRVLAFAGDTTWQWWLQGRKKIHQQFWRQAMLWLIRRDTLSEGFRLDLEQRRLLIDETPDLAIEWFGGSDNEPMPKELRVQLARDGQVLANLSTTSESANLRKAKISGLDQPGLYFATLSAEGADGKSYETNIAFVVKDDSRELARPAADWQMMENIVSANQLAGGRLLFPENVGEAIDWFRERQQATKVATIEKRRLGDGAWDSWMFLVLFCALMSIEWAVRKTWQLP